MIEEWQKAWAAGIIDFQGHIQKSNNKLKAANTQQLTLYVDTSITEIVNRLAAMTGTSIETKEHHKLKQEWLRRGCEDHCPDAHVHIRPVAMPLTGRWSAAGAALAIVLWNLRPYMTTDREPWDWAMSQCLSQMKMTGRGSAAVIGAAKRLHALGWELPPVMTHLVPKALEAAG